MRIGRNDPCHCGSGRKYKKCHLPLEEESRPLSTPAARERRNVRPPPPEILEKLAQFEKRRDEHKHRFGDVREVVHADFQGHKFVAVGAELHYSQTWKTFPDFLFDYIKRVLNRAFGEDWSKTELTKPLERRHPILQWYDALCELQARAKAESGDTPADGIYETVIDGPSAAYLLLAYDLYVLADNQRLQNEVLRRLKDIHKFQGARYELAVAATMIRAGFNIEYEDETDTTTKHAEFIARHKETGEIVAVEAKGRRRVGVMGWIGEKTPRENFRLGIDDLLRRAIDKRVKGPFVIFIDANMPPAIAFEEQEKWLAEVGELLPRVAHGFGQDGIFRGVPYSLLVITNFPHDYGERGRPDPGKLGFISRPQPALFPIRPELTQIIEVAVRQYGSVPQSFPETGVTSV
jgi:hypothetical protein